MNLDSQTIGISGAFCLLVFILKKRTHSFLENSKKWDPVGPGRVCLLIIHAHRPCGTWAYVPVKFLKNNRHTGRVVPLNGIVIRK